MPKKPKGDWKANQFDWDRIITLSEAECCFSLSQQEVAIILSYTDMIGWITRWYSETGETVDFSTIETFKNQLEYKLMSGCCPDNDAIFRFSPDGTYQRSDDNGETWEDAPLDDPRRDVIEAPPISGTDSDAKKCAAADNVRDSYKAMRDNTITILTGSATVLLIIAGLVGAIGGIFASTVVGAAIAPMLFGLAGLLLTLTPESVEDQIDDIALDLFRCMVYCNMGNDGRLSVGGLAELLDDIADSFSGFPETFFYTITASLGEVGINNAATMGVATQEDCEECDCSPACIDPDFIMHGTLVGQTATSIDIQAVMATYNTITAYWAVYGSLEMDWCCYYCSFAVQSGSIDSGGLYDCVTGGSAGGAGLKRRVEFYSNSSPFVIRYNFDPDGTDCS